MKKRSSSMQTTAPGAFFGKKSPPKKADEEALRRGSSAMDTDYLAFQTPQLPKTLEGFPDLCSAIAVGDVDEVRAMLQNAKQDANVATPDGDLPLHVACMHSHTHIVTLLIQAGAHIHSMDKYGDTPLHLACRHANVRIVQLLLNELASTAIVNRRGWTALEEAEERARHDDVGSSIYHLVLEASIPKSASSKEAAEPKRTRSRTYSVSLEKDPSFVQSVISWFKKL
ncbi:hypothetical protein SDRG_06450 [Saprolegnia diclina VS20]|uniref:Uncharacterized protein n=1 Tax=Saprolegnia diclina (strain VS20) TaxID=1156394 RepID=T0QR08_SAPDV|nr:hypothetical protein SDRG_06450 [Saprolegnia diclina VS20]EQC36345.1 hypothetical protein SDRG_06450 [Saprolegnia diclina VS20]|eukprot:XP_008610451.1 hypothetical protein SDRG_06450 [Saprolegnia diclina VS20]